MLQTAIKSATDLTVFHESQTFAHLFSFLEALNDAAADRPLSAVTPSHPVVQQVLALLRLLTASVAEHPPISTGSRFGNPAFRDWLTSAQETAFTELCSKGGHHQDASSYLANSFGNWQRIDYGTGHELHFVAFCFVLVKEASKLPAPGSSVEAPPLAGTRIPLEQLSLGLFPVYISLMRTLQRTYWLEPAGSHGVWGLDDYHFLPFLFGSAQLRGHDHLRPKSIHNAELVQELSKDYLYFDAIQTINETKTIPMEASTMSSASMPPSSAESGPSQPPERPPPPHNNALRWHSPMLDDISAVKCWTKVNQGLLRMYRVEVLGKLPIMQHFLFGEYLVSPISGGASVSNANSNSKAPATTTTEEGDRNGQAQRGDGVHPADHVHVAGSVGGLRGDCCGNPLPSRFAAAANLKVKPEPVNEPRLFPID